MKKYTIKDLEELVGEKELQILFHKYYEYHMQNNVIPPNDEKEIKISHITHEPYEPINFPKGHVNVYPIESLDVAECSAIKIHDSLHYLHDTTACELYKMLKSYIHQRKLFYKSLGIEFDL